MYKIIGADGKEYGPVSADQLRQWIAQGRANAQTRAATPGMMEWKPLASFPEFSLSFTISPMPPMPSTLTGIPVKKTNGFAVTGMILGIASLIFCCCWGGVPFNILALIFSIIGLVQIRNEPARYEGKGMAITGLILAIGSLLLASVFLLAKGLGLAWAGGFMQDM